MRIVRLGSLAGLTLAVALSACGDAGEAKAGASKMAASVLPAEASKEGPSRSTKNAQIFTVTATTPASSKTVSEISVGQTRTGSLTSGDPQLGDGSHMDHWALSISSPTQVDIRLSSSDFDTYLLLGAGSPGNIDRILAEDDDGGGGLNSRIAGTLEPGSYTIVANSYAGGATGSYELSVTGQPVDDGGSEDALQGRLEAGATASGQLTSAAPTLDDGSHYHMWQFSGEAGQQVTITLRSGAFDTYLILLQGMSLNPDAVVAQDDDGAGDLNSQITATLPETGTYTVVANSYGAGETGAYELALETAMTDWADMYPGDGDPDGKYAVVVGIDDYPGTRSDLRGPVDDATLVRDALVDRFGFSPDDIVFLQDGEATRLGIANAVVRHLGQAGPDGTAVFFYSGHGTQMEENTGVTGALDPEEGNDVDEALAVYDGIILDEEVNFLLQQIEAENTLVLVDACFSGTATRGPPGTYAKVVAEENRDDFRKPSNFITSDLDMDFGFGAGATAFEDALANPDRHVFMAASTEDELSWAIGSWPDRDGPASLWTYYWAQVVNEVPTSTSFNEIQRLVHDRVVRHVENNQGLDTQTPQLMAPGDKASMSIGEFLRAP